MQLGSAEHGNRTINLYFQQSKKAMWFAFYCLNWLSKLLFLITIKHFICTAKNNRYLFQKIKLFAIRCNFIFTSLVQNFEFTGHLVVALFVVNC